MIRQIVSKAPARIDLGGGTLDLWPLYLFFDHATTVHFAINRYASTCLSYGVQSAPSQGAPLRLVSKDRGTQHEFQSYGDLLEAFHGDWKARSLDSSLWLQARTVRHFYGFWRKSGSLVVETESRVPAGSGLGGSSALNISLCSALQELTLATYSKEELITVAKDLESTVLESPAGIQDYWPASYGGISALHMDAGKVSRKVFYKHKEFIEQHIVLCYSGVSRLSGVNNWQVYQQFIQGDQKVRSALAGIAKAAQKIEEGLDRLNSETVIQGLNQEWNHRKDLTDSMATPEMLTWMKEARLHGARAEKVCGAGGGGCFFFWVEPQDRDRLLAYLARTSVEVLDFQVDEGGCQVSHVGP